MTDDSYFIGRTFEEVLLEGQKLKERRKIGGAFLYEDTITYLFRTNYGKSLLVFQLAFAAATGTSIADCPALRNDCPPMKTLVVDLELENRDLYERHGAALNNMSAETRENLIYAHEKPENRMLIGLHLLEKIEETAVRSEAGLVIIDNISKLLPDSLKPDIATYIISTINSIRKKTGASILVIGHTTKGNPMFAIQPTDYFGTSMIQNFFSEVSFLDKTNDGKFFLCHSKTKHKELYMTKVPVFKRGEHPVAGVGFNFQKMKKIEKIQLPFFGQELPDNKVHLRRRRDLDRYAEKVQKLINSGDSVNEIAGMLEVSRSAIYQLLQRSQD